MVTWWINVISCKRWKDSKVTIHQCMIAVAQE